MSKPKVQDPTPDTGKEKQQRGIQSVEVSGRLLQALANARTPLGLSELAAAAALTPAQAFTYLVSLVKLGLIKRDYLSGNYEPGPLSLRLGLMHLEHQVAYRIAIPYAAQLAESLGHSVAICTPGPQGPTIVRYEHGGFPLHVNLHIGTVMSLPLTATGRVFCAYSEPETLRQMLGQQSGNRTTHPSHPTPVHAAQVPDAHFQKNLAVIREQGMERGINAPSPGISSLCAPVFDDKQILCMTLTVIGSSGDINVDWNGSTALALKNAAHAISGMLTAQTGAAT
ncbi:IclR family transcriptional regulator [Undibacterium terreum]|uniref:IclR family transcriptional regulator n=1 Tax=Undibacterium terreum TaxID=1224302 RepID=UPI001E29BB46|nr:helix-turn-helix domain-containing protein [Undibacterium terreum]